MWVAQTSHKTRTFVFDHVKLKHTYSSQCKVYLSVLFAPRKHHNVGECSSNLTQLENLYSSNWTCFFETQLFWQSCIRLQCTSTFSCGWTWALVRSCFLFHTDYTKTKANTKMKLRNMAKQISAHTSHISLKETDADICSGLDIYCYLNGFYLF